MNYRVAIVRLLVVVCAVWLTVPGWSSAQQEEPLFYIRSFQPNALVTADGSYWVWGEGYSVPTQIHGLTDVEAAFPGQLVMKRDGSVWHWVKDYRTSAVEVYPMEELRHPTEVRAYFSNVLVLDADGNVYALPGDYRDGDAALRNEYRPVLLDDIGEVAGIALYYEDRYDSDGQWRDSSWIAVFRMRDGAVRTRSMDADADVPAARPSGLQRIVQVEGRYAVDEDGTVWTWPDRLNLGEQSRPTKLEGIDGVELIRTNNRSTVAVDRDSRLWFWGRTVTGYSDGAVSHEQPSPVRLDTPGDVRDAVVAERSLLVLTDDGSVYEASINRETMPADPEFTRIASDVQRMEAGQRHVIMQKRDGTLWGWGVNKAAELGYGDYEFTHEGIVPVRPPVAVELNGERVQLSNGAIVHNGQAFVPLRSIFERLGAAVVWDGKEKTVSIERAIPASDPVAIRIDYITGAVSMNGRPVELANAPFISGNTAYVPLRFVSETLGAQVEWLQNEYTIEIAYDL